MENGAHKMQLPPVKNSAITLPNPHAAHAPKLATVAIGLQASSQTADISMQIHHAPLSPDAPYVYAEDGSICIENQGSISVRKCIVTNEYADETFRLALRDPKSPSTWWGKRPHLKVGLSNSVVSQIRRGIFATWTAVGIGVGLILFGTLGALISLNAALILSCYGVGVILAVVSGYFRANIPITAPIVGRAFTTIAGAHPGFLKQFDQYKNGELVMGSD